MVAGLSGRPSEGEPSQLATREDLGITRVNKLVRQLVNANLVLRPLCDRTRLCDTGHHGNVLVHDLLVHGRLAFQIHDSLKFLAAQTMCVCEGRSIVITSAKPNTAEQPNPKDKQSGLIVGVT